LHLDACVLQSLAILWSNCYGTLDRLAVHVQGDALAAALVELDIDSLALIEVLENDVNVDGGGEEQGSHRVQLGEVRGVELTMMIPNVASLLT
jgi:hypothetical protein